jgi:hypothetical protein
VYVTARMAHSYVNDGLGQEWNIDNRVIKRFDLRFMSA